jgi:cytochrome c biogenesis protein CcdA
VRLLAGVLVLLLASSAPAGAQLLGGPTANLTPIVESRAVAGETVRGALRVQLPEGLHVQSDQPRDPLLIPTVVGIDPPEGVRAVEAVFPEPFEFLVLDDALDVFEHDFSIGVAFVVADDVPSGPLVVPARVQYQACNDSVCFPPVRVDLSWTLDVVPAGTPVTRSNDEVLGPIAFGTGSPPPGVSTIPAPRITLSGPDPGTTSARLDRFTVAATAGGYLGTDDFLQFVRNAEAGVEEPGLFEGRGPLAILLLVLLGGLALNLTPCVLPMIPINLAIIGAGSSAGSRTRGFLLGGVYGAAMAAVYGLLGLVVILTAGTFGTINASPWFNLGIAIVFVALALAMFDVFTIDLSRFSGAGPSAESRGRFAVAFGMGAIAALLAGACVAPVVIQVIVFSSDLYARGTALALALPFLLGVGMAIPWPLAGAGLTALPRPGPWMVRAKQAFGVFILATAAYYGYLSYTLFANQWVDPEEVASSVQEKLAEGWYASFTDGLPVAEREGKPVLVDLWATWCKNCLVMDRTTLADEAVVAALDGYVKIKFQAEDAGDASTQAVMRRLDAIGLPAYAILHPAGGPSE